jgi:hypothetical protein
MMLALILYTIALLLLLWGARLALLKVFGQIAAFAGMSNQQQSGDQSAELDQEATTPVTAGVEQTATEYPALETVPTPLPQVEDWSLEIPRAEIVARLERQLRNSPSYNPDL